MDSGCNKSWARRPTLVLLALHTVTPPLTREEGNETALSERRTGSLLVFFIVFFFSIEYSPSCKPKAVW